MITRLMGKDMRIACLARWLTVFTIIALVNGCLMPTPPHGGFGVITSDSIDFLRPATTTRADVLLRLGNPNYGAAEELFVYRWSRVHGYWSIGFGTAADIQKEHFLAIEFAQDNSVKRFKLIEPWLFQSPQTLLNEWRMEKTESPVSKSDDNQSSP